MPHTKRMLAQTESPPTPTHKHNGAGVPNVLLAAVNAAVTGIVISDMRLPDNPLVFVNDAFCRMTGYSWDEVVGRNCRFLQGEGTDPQTVARLRSAIESSQPVVVTLVNYTKAGRRFHNELHMSPVFGASGKAEFFVGVQHDVTARIEAEIHLKELATRLARSNGVLQLFADNAAKDVIDLLQKVLAHSEGILHPQGRPAEPDRAAVRSIHDAALRTKSFLIEILEYCSLASVPLQLERVSLGTMLSEIQLCNLGKPSVHANPADLDFEITCDPALVRRAVTELVESAFRSVPPGEVPNVELRVGREGHERVYFEVADRGTGTARSNIHLVVDPSARLHSPGRCEGLGLGPSLADRIAERHGGRVEVTPREGGGVVARFYLSTAQNWNAALRAVA
jgi:PAS domain S-box-containing protein